MSVRLELPFVQMPDYYNRLLVSNIQNNTATNTNLELYIQDHVHLNQLIKKIFKDIDADGFVGKILSVNGFVGIRNRLASAFIEHAITGNFPDQVNQSVIQEALLLEHNWRHFTPQGFSRAFLLGFYLKLASIETKISAAIIQDRHLEYMKISKGKSVRIDWLMLCVLHFDFYLGPERYMSCLQSNMSFDAIFSLLLDHEKDQMLKNLLAYASSIGDLEFFTSLVEN
ncbi:MAG: hypothetical protein L6Q33_08480 [Bacteriovoracaceae bacterium]|nr:hypothetical protein [Bacteriovoracaceae bacterium]